MDESVPTTGSFTLRIKSAEPFPAIGHQADHTSQYKIDNLPPTWTPTPPPPPFIGPITPTPVLLPDPGVIFPTAIPFAVNAWNVAVATPWPHVLFCKEGNCSSKNTDGKGTTINVESGGIESGSTRLWLWSDDCGPDAACVKPKNLIDRPPFYNPMQGQNMRNMLMVIEEPAWFYTPPNGMTGTPEQHTRYIWTNTSPNRNGYRVIQPDANGNTRVLVYLPGVLMHEFGHTAGLEDLYKYTGNYNGYLMEGDTYPTNIPDKDREYMRQVYRNKHGSKPH